MCAPGEIFTTNEIKNFSNLAIYNLLFDLKQIIFFFYTIQKRRFVN